MPKQIEDNGRKKVSARLFASTRKKSTIDRVVEKFKQLLRDGELRPGDRIPNETQLAKSFGTSRGSIREAVKMLVSFGVLQVKWGDGTYVSSSISESAFDHRLFQLLITSDDNRHLRELRQLMEHGVAQLAVEHANEADLAEAEQVHAEMLAMIQSGESDPEVLAGIDAKFHLAIGRATHNPLIEKIYNFAMELYYPSIVVTHANRTTRDEMMQSPLTHRLMLDAIRNRDKEAAVRAARATLDTWYNLL